MDTLERRPLWNLHFWLIAVGVVLVCVAVGIMATSLAGGAIFATDPRELQVVPSPLLPAGEGEYGLYLGRTDNVIRMGSGNITVHAVFDEQGRPTGRFDSGYDGPVLEVVLAPGVQLYKDVTEFPAFSANQRSAQQPIQQVLVPVTDLEELTADSVLIVWGERSAERIAAQTLVYKIH